MKWPGYTRSDVLRGLTIYAAGDTIAALLLGEFLWSRLVGLMAVGALVYAWEVPNYFRWIDRRPLGSVKRTALAILYFNPLWIARHVAFIHLFSGRTELLTWDLLRVGGWSFLCNLPVSLIGNFVIQNLLPLRYRFLGSAIFSTMMAVFYAASARWFH